MMNVVIIEDESIAAERLEKLLKETAPDFNILAKLTSIKDSVKWLSRNTVDLIFLDIQLSDGLSFSIFDNISLNIPIIFTTAYDQYAIKAFKLNSISYLLKPVRKDDLSEAIEKFRTLSGKDTVGAQGLPNSSQNIDFENLIAAISGKSAFRKRFLIQVGDKFRKIETTDIAYFYACEKNVFLKTFEGSSCPCDYTLDTLEEMVDPSEFFRINRKYFISMKSIKSMVAWSRSRIKVIVTPPADEMETIVSIDRSNSFKKWMNN